ncbi:DUF3710 domain-containing protein [Frankia sp. AgB1.9]|uniref:DUF3710 domain-containing protein n=1 Tax=unclassified Frankia TaxID=2632575 RepID=UPI001934A606|nr:MULTISPECIES: DUF3710 domain-containing protein [unclassified Frankia]MBL7490842.1 DUF3710 domain-containing protein [Frankia sp. AgW1.1]MBL7551011.1 DUF3710 domain-containing protein [Frankia sp. AgB1.9]MBL7621208.1 DUF3710 domain-containing protein [Frankia sp. AgB1.8]
MVRWRRRDDERHPPPTPTATRRRGGAAPPATETGPYDLADAPREPVRQFDLGSLLVPVLPDVAYQFEVAGPDQDRRVVAVIAVADGSTMRITVHATPRHGLGDEVRAELLRSARPALASMTDHALDPELSTRTSPTGAREAPEPDRLLSIDGPRWLLLAAMTTPADAAPATAGQSEATPRARGAAVLEDVLHAVVVVRGDRAMPAGAPLPLKLPTDPDLPDLAVDDRGDPDALADELGRLPPIGALTADPRRISYEVVAAPGGGLSRNLTTWG